MLPTRLLDWFHILRTMHIKEEWMRNGFELPKRGEVLPHLKVKEARIPFPSGKNLNEVFFWALPLYSFPIIYLLTYSLLAPITIYISLHACNPKRYLYEYCKLFGVQS